MMPAGALEAIVGSLVARAYAQDKTHKIADFNGMEIRPVIAADIVTGTPKVCEELLTLIKEN